MRVRVQQLTALRSVHAPLLRSALAEAARIEAAALAEVSFGGPMLHAIGYVYVNKADQFLGNPLVCGSFAVRPPFCGHP